MARDEAPPFARGETYYNNNSEVGEIAKYGPGGINLEGKEYWTEITPVSRYSTFVQDPSGRRARVKILRNRSAINLLPGRVARHATGLTNNGGYPYGTGSDGYYFQAADPIAGVVDEFLPPAGVPPGDLFYAVIEGPTSALSSSTASIANSAQLAVTTGTSAVSSDAGFVGPLNESSTTLAQYISKLGRAEANQPAAIVVAGQAVPCVVFVPIV